MDFIGREPVISLRPEEELQASGGTQENVPDIDGVVHSLAAGVGFPSQVIRHRLDNTPQGLIVFWKEGFCDVYVDVTATLDDEVMTVVKSADVNIKILVY